MMITREPRIPSIGRLGEPPRPKPFGMHIRRASLHAGSAIKDLLLGERAYSLESARTAERLAWNALRFPAPVPAYEAATAGLQSIQEAIRLLVDSGSETDQVLTAFQGAVNGFSTAYQLSGGDVARGVAILGAAS